MGRVLSAPLGTTWYVPSRRAILDGFRIVMAVDAQLVRSWLSLSKCVFDCLGEYDSQPGSPSCRLGWRRIVGWLQVPGSVTSWPVWASQEPPISTALLTHLGTALRALHSCRLLGLPAALTGSCSHPALWIHWSRLTGSMQMIPGSKTGITIIMYHPHCFTRLPMFSTYVCASTCLSSHVLD